MATAPDIHHIINNIRSKGMLESHAARQALALEVFGHHYLATEIESLCEKINTTQHRIAADESKQPAATSFAEMVERPWHPDEARLNEYKAAWQRAQAKANEVADQLEASR